MDWSNLDSTDIRRVVSNIVLKNGGFEFPDYDNFLAITNLKDSNNVVKYFYECKHVHFMYIGKIAGFWELSWDIFDNSDVDLYPMQLVVVDMEKTDHKWFYTLLADIKLFKSANDAKRNGWNKALEKGDFLFKKKTFVLRII